MTADESEEVAGDLGVQSSFLTAPAVVESAGYQTYRMEEAVEEEAKGSGCLCRCFKWLICVAVVGILVLIILFSLDVVSPREKPCPLNSLPIPTPAQIAVAGDLFREGCVAVRGTLVSREIDMLVLEIDRGELRATGDSPRTDRSLRRNLPGQAAGIGWTAQGGGGWDILGPFRAGPRVGPGMVAEPAG